jgi:hypothetical protein
MDISHSEEDFHPGQNISVILISSEDFILLF